ncbi:MAG: hypothetical protein JRC86_00755 [Deltaproteobacteria bacterium]|nr:hypothetical protein [Deltaproteobacteria bacterium]
MQKSRITLTLHGAYKGKTIVLNRRQFVNGVLTGTGQPEELVCLQKYYTTSYNCTCVIEPVQPTPPPKPVLTPNEPVKDINEPEVHIPDPTPTPVVPTQRQESIMMAIEGIDQSNWISGPIDHPRVSDVATLLNDPTVTTEEIMECMEKWWVDETAKVDEPELVPEEPEVEVIPEVETELLYVQEETVEAAPEPAPEKLLEIGEPEVSEPQEVSEPGDEVETVEPVHEQAQPEDNKALLEQEPEADDADEDQAPEDQNKE